VVAGAPYERWYIDFTGPLPKSDKGHIWILTSWIRTQSGLRHFRSEARRSRQWPIVVQVFTGFGTPLSIFSDQGKGANRRTINEVCRLFGIKKLRTTPYKALTNQVERFHRTVNSVLAKIVSEHQKD